MKLEEATEDQLRAWIADPRNAAVKAPLERRLMALTGAALSGPITHLLVRLPLPSPELRPNTARVHWAAKSRAVRRMRETAKEAARLALAGRPAPRWEKAQVRAVFSVKAQRRRDEDNALASLKSAFDGIADAGVVMNDSGLTHLPPVFRIDRERPRVEIHIEEIT